MSTLTSVDIRAAEMAYAELFRWIEEQEYLGYDPYDGSNTRHEWLKQSRAPRVFLTYLHKFSPFNLRPFFGIEKSLNPQGLALITSSMLRYPPQGGLDLEALAEQHIDYICSRSLVDHYGYHCWNGNDMYVQTRKEYQTPFMPGVVGTDTCARTILTYLDLYPEREDLKAIVRSVRDFMLNELFQHYEGAAFFRYKPMTPSYFCTYNASLLAASYILLVNDALEESVGEAEAEAAFRDALRRQHADGSWGYSIDLRTGQEKPQIDFHQGFVLDSLLDYLELCEGDAEVQEVYLRGLRFYREKQFTPEGQGLYRYPRRWPANIHNQAQGIITFVRAGRFAEEHSAFASTVLNWTLEHMRSDQGYFYFLKYPSFTNRIPYMRWGQAWMMNALSHFLYAHS